MRVKYTEAPFLLQKDGGDGGVRLRRERSQQDTIGALRLDLIL